MTISLKHKFVSEVEDGDDDTVVRPSNWNDEHDLEMASGRILGRVTEDAGPVEELGASDIRSLAGIGSAKDARRNRIVNPGMVISQQNGTAAGTTHQYYPVDQFIYGASHDGTISVAQVASATPGGSPNRIRATVTGTDATIGAAQYASIITLIEGTRVADFLWGTASARDAILRFGVKAPAGTYGIRIANSAVDRVYLAEFTIAGGEANTDLVREIVIPGDTSGTWLTTTGIGFRLQWTLASGTDFHGSAGWNTSNVIATSNQSNFIGTNSAVFELFDVGLYLDLDDSGIAPAWELPDYAETLRDCQRYWKTNQALPFWVVTTTDGTAMSDTHEMRVAPAVSIIDGTNAVLEPQVAQRDLSAATNPPFVGSRFDVTVAAFSGAQKMGFIEPGKIAFNARM